MPISAYDQINYAAYKPLSTQEIWAPGQAIREQQDKLSEEYSNAEQIAQQGFSGLDPTIDKAAIDTQKQFMDQTKAAADELATKGFIDSGRRRNLLQLKSIYANQIVPLQNALTQRTQRAEEYRKLSMDKNNILGTNPNDVSLTDIIGNPNALNYSFLSGAQMAKDVANEAKPFADRFNNKDVKDYGAKVGFDHLLAIRQGVDPTTVLAAMKNDPRVMGTEGGRKVYEQLVGIVNSVTDRYGLKNIATTPEEYNRGWQIASSGLSEAIGKVTPMQMHDDKGAFNYEQSLKNSTKSNPIIFGNDMNTKIFDEGYTMDDLNNISELKTPEFNNDGNFKRKFKSYFNVINNSYLPDVDFGEKSRAITDAYRSANHLPSTMNDKSVFEKMQSDIKTKDLLINKAKQHNYTPIVDVQTGKQILSTLFSNIPSAEFVDYTSDYKGDSSTGIDYTTIAKRSGFSSGQQLLDYMDKHPELISKNNTDGRFMMQIPSNVNGVDKQGNLTFKNDVPEFKHIGFVDTNSHKVSVNAISKVRERESEGKQDEVEVASRQVQNNGRIYTIKSFHDGKSKKIIEQLYDSNGNKIKTQEESVDGFINDENQNIYHGEILNAYQIAHQKDNKSE